MDVKLPDASFYLWAGPDALGMTTPNSPALLAQYNVTVLPGSYLAREAQGINPGAAACAWPWWPKPPNAWKPPAHRPIHPIPNLNP
jgi:hypothetical protein